MTQGRPAASSAARANDKARLLDRLRLWLAAPALAATRGIVDRALDVENDHQVRLRVEVGRLLSHQVARTATALHAAEFSAFSQSGEDGIIEYLIQGCDISPETFVEIGVDTYAEANTRFLAEHRRWTGVVVDMQPNLVADLERTHLHWRSQVRAIRAVVTRENVRALLAELAPGDVGLLSVDIDGSDYWVLEQLVELRPAMIVVEYNALFGNHHAVSVPYEPAFDRARPERHNIYYGASLAAFAHLLGRAGYNLVGCVDAGNNAFFVHESRLRGVQPVSVAEAFRPPRFVEHRDRQGRLTGITDRRRQLHDVRDLPLVDVVGGTSIRVADLLDSG